MEKITKQHIKQIKEGNHAVLMDCLDFLLDSYEEDKWDLGYKACLDDLSVRSYRLAEHIHRNFGINSTDLKAPLDDLAKVIEEYYTNALNK